MPTYIRAEAPDFGSSVFAAKQTPEATGPLIQTDQSDQSETNPKSKKISPKPIWFAKML